MKKLYFIRHGESVYNRAGKFAGSSDPELTDTGHEQARQAGRQAKANNLSFDVILSSPLQRAHHTAIHIAEALEYPHDQIILYELLKERHYGELEGASNISDLSKRYFEDESVIDEVNEVEKLHELQARADEALDYLRSLGKESILVVSHGAFGRALFRSANNLPVHIRDIRYKNADLVRII